MRTATSSSSFQPARYFMVNGMVRTLRTSRKRRSTSGRSRSRPEPPLHFTTLLTGQPKLRSRISKPRSWQTRAASAITAGSLPKSCAEMGCSSGWKARYFKVLLVLRVPSEARTPCELVNSVIINPQPPRPRMKRRKTVSVTPAMGASTVAGAIFTGPIENESGNVRMPSDDLILPITGEKRNSAAAHPLCKGGKRVKAGQVVLLVLIGMIGGALLIYMAQRLRPAMPADVSAQVRESAPVSVAGAVALKPSPMPERHQVPNPDTFDRKSTRL